MVRIHLLWHPIIPIESSGSSNFLNMNQIWDKSVKEQYNYCYKNNLKHIWCYLWSEWYHPEMWKLWAQASNLKLNVLRSTMVIESHWRVLKHDFFSSYNRARLDLIIYIIIVKVIPRQIDRLQLFRDNRYMPK
ncbi:9204_t:CDS:1, partial [Racocetra persica]